jgi:predicted RNA binding protein YcfA (HicA-like mRNA interferase family)
MSKTIKYADFECLLLRLGFRSGHTTGTQLIFEHPAFDARIVLPPYQAEEAVRPHHWMNVRWLLDVNGILERDAFDKMLENGVDRTDCSPPNRITTEDSRERVPQAVGRQDVA